MKKIKEVLAHLTNPEMLMGRLREILRQIDPTYPAEEKKFLRASAALEASLDSAGEFLKAMEERTAAAALSMGWQGFSLNLEIFRDPVNALPLLAGGDALYREEHLELLPGAAKARACLCAFQSRLRELPEPQQTLADMVIDYYAYLETTGYKVAHYYGFVLADFLLHHLIPEYTGNAGWAESYRASLGTYLQVDLRRIA